MADKITITIDGRIVETKERTMLLEIIEGCGIYLPQLCNHHSLPPSGACRLCVVEITKKEWNGGSKIVTSCLYPAEDGLIVSTRSPGVLETRRNLLELYMARCPESTHIKEIARLEGLEVSSYKPRPDGDNCVLCGLCTRVCQECGPGAISTLSRGPDKIVGPDPDGVAEDCTGCRACAHICPTGAINFSQENKVLNIWGQTFDIPVCTVAAETCRGCGICEEVCPYSIPRVNLHKEGLGVSQISETACVGCGICAGCCPTGAIKQEITGKLTDYKDSIFNKELRNKSIVFKCSRSPILSDDQDVIEVSCIGNVDISILLYIIAAGAKSVALMCRDKFSCPYRLGGDKGEARIEVAKKLLLLCGIEKERISLLNPPFGQDGPLKTWSAFKEKSSELPAVIENPYPIADRPAAGLDLALEIVQWLKNRTGAGAQIPAELSNLFEQDSGADNTVLYLDRLPELHLLLTLVSDQNPVIDLLGTVTELFHEKGIKARGVFTDQELFGKNINRIITFGPQPVLDQTLQDKVTTINSLAGIADGNDHYRFTFTISPKKRRDLLRDLYESEKQPLVNSPELYLQYRVLLRPGSWQQKVIEKPLLNFATKIKSNICSRDDEMKRIENHPILPQLEKEKVKIFFNGSSVTALEGEVITSALYAAGITVFGHHYRDGGAQGIYCVNGQCSQCMVIADGKPVKGCMTPVNEGMRVESVEGYPELVDDLPLKALVPSPEETAVDVLIIGGGPAGISAAIELGTVGAEVLIVDDKQELGGKLSLQTHNFFGSVADCYAGDRGVDIGYTLAGKMLAQPTVKTWLNATVVGVFNDGKFGISVDGVYRLVKPERVLFTTGAREKSLALPGGDLPGVYGAGAFQTLVNRDLIKCAERLFIIGGGNVGLIGAYHALQAGIDVVGLVEALPKCGGYKVHEDKIKRLGVPVMTSHTVLRIEGGESVERVIISAIDDKFKPLAGTERVFEVDTVLMAVGLSPVNELYEKAKEYGLSVYAAGDSREIAEASAAIFSGKITGRKIAKDIGYDFPIPGNWEEFGELLKHHSAEADTFKPVENGGSVYPLIRCVQEIPCNPCTEACPKNCITMENSILDLPEFKDECIGCGSCVLACPGLAINLVIDDYDPKKEKVLLMMPYEFHIDKIPLGSEVVTTGLEGEVIGSGKIIAYKTRESHNRRLLLLLEVPYADRHTVAGFRIREADPGKLPENNLLTDEDPIVCRCERVRKSEIVAAIRDGVRDMNQLKAQIRTGLGGCNGKTCTDLILRIYHEEGIPLEDITMPTHRPLVAEVHLGDFIAAEETKKSEDTGEADDVDF